MKMWIYRALLTFPERGTTKIVLEIGEAPVLASPLEYTTPNIIKVIII
jgi:hypothetical protein